MITLNHNDRRPLYEQIVDGLEALVSTGVLRPSEQLPTVRQLSQELSINPNTIQKAYSELERRGVIYSVKGRGTFAAEDPGQARALRQEQLRRELQDLLARAAAADVTREQFEQWCGQAAPLRTEGEIDE